MQLTCSAICMKVASAKLLAPGGEDSFLLMRRGSSYILLSSVRAWQCICTHTLAELLMQAMHVCILVALLLLRPAVKSDHYVNQQLPLLATVLLYVWCPGARKALA